MHRILLVILMFFSSGGPLTAHAQGLGKGRLLIIGGKGTSFRYIVARGPVYN